MCRAKARRYVTFTRPSRFDGAAALRSNGVENSFSVSSRKLGPECVAQDSPSSPADFQGKSAGLKASATSLEMTGKSRSSRKLWLRDK
jgi:hypothetical protein